MPESLNVDIAGTIAEAGDARTAPARRRRERFVEILEACVLALVAIATAWSGYQAARWDGRQAELYGESGTIRVRAAQLLTLGGQERLLDVATFNTWIEAHIEGRKGVAALYERRFSPEFKTAFDAWIALEPFSNADAPPGPSFMPEYVNPQIEEGSRLNALATRGLRRGNGRATPRG